MQQFESIYFSVRSWCECDKKKQKKNPTTFLFQTIQFIQTVLIRLIQFRENTNFVYTVKYQNSSIYNNSV